MWYFYGRDIHVHVVCRLLSVRVSPNTLSWKTCPSSVRMSLSVRNSASLSKDGAMPATQSTFPRIRFQQSMNEVHGLYANALPVICMKLVPTSNDGVVHMIQFNRILHHLCV